MKQNADDSLCVTMTVFGENRHRYGLNSQILDIYGNIGYATCYIVHYYAVVGAWQVKYSSYNIQENHEDSVFLTLLI